MFFNQTGKMAVATRLRMLSERITEESRKIYEAYGVGLRPKWFPVFYALSQGETKGITEMAQEIGHSHPSVVKIVREMVQAGVAVERKDVQDGRRNIITLSAYGKELAEKIQDQYQDVTQAIEHTLGQTTHNIWHAMEEFEYHLDQLSLFDRVMREKKQREAHHVQLVDYKPQYREAFKTLNEEWIQKYFKMEEADHKALDHPKENILDPGGEIVVALYQGEPLGVCAMVAMTDPKYEFELAKMAVSPKAQGMGMGWLLGEAIIDRAKARGADWLYLESNTRLVPAIKLYEKLGFTKVTGRITPYERSNIQMELKLNNAGS